MRAATLRQTLLRSASSSRSVLGSGSSAIAGEHEGDGFVHDRAVDWVDGRDEVGPYELGPQELAADHAEELFGHRGCRLWLSVGRTEHECAGLRFGLQDGGCSGYTSLLDFEEKPADEDLVHEQHGVKVFIHPLHLPFVQDTLLDYKERTFEEGFDIQNPHAKRYCGCGESFDG